MRYSFLTFHLIKNVGVYLRISLACLEFYVFMLSAQTSFGSKVCPAGLSC